MPIVLIFYSQSRLKLKLSSACPELNIHFNLFLVFFECSVLRGYGEQISGLKGACFKARGLVLFGQSAIGPTRL